MEITSLSGSYSVAIEDDAFFYVGGDTGLVIIRKSDKREVAYAAVLSGVTSLWVEESEFI